MRGSLQNHLSGIVFAVSAGILWGVVPIYIDFIGAVDPLEIVAHRSLWSLILLTGLVIWRQQAKSIWKVFWNRRLILGFGITTFLLIANWTVYVVAVQSGNVVSAALGYFVYPIFTVLLSIAFLGERLDHWAWVAIGCVVIGVLAKAVIISGMPWVALLLSVTFSLYAVVRKRLRIEPILGLFLETLLLLPVTLGFFTWLAWSGKPLFFGEGAMFVVLAIFIGVLTVVPLILFHEGNRRLSMTTASLLFYSNPTTQLLIATLIFIEAFSMVDLLAFVPIWMGIAVYFVTRPRLASPMMPAG